MKKLFSILCFCVFTNFYLSAQTQSQDLNMGLYQLQFLSANGGSNRIQSFGGTFPGTWLFKSIFDDIHIDAGANSSNKFKIFFKTGGEEIARFHSNGNFGIGTTNPIYAKFQIKGGATHRLLAVNRPNNDVPALYIGNDGSNNAAIAANNSDLTFGKDLSGIYTEYMRIENSNGDVGIGTTDTNGYKLGVKGKIAAEEIKVQVHPWSDFVFENTYNLPTLKEVEQHITEKGYLKDIPSAEEVKENGIFLGEMNAKLLQKIEELTLYTIQQEKQLKIQEERLQKIEAILNSKKI